MQIHELNDFRGSLGTGSYLAVDDGMDTGKVSAQQIVADANAKISEVETSLNARIDNIIAPGAAPSEAEIIDARYGADGFLYSSLGQAIRGQVDELTGSINDIADPKINLLPAHKSNSVNVKGVDVTYNDGLLIINGTGNETGGRTTPIISFMLPAGNYKADALEATTTTRGIYLNKMSDNSVITNWSYTDAPFSLLEATEVFIGIIVADEESYNETVRLQISLSTVDSNWIAPSTRAARDTVAREKANANDIDLNNFEQDIRTTTTKNLATGKTVVLNHYYKDSESYDTNYRYIKEIPVLSGITYNISHQARFVAFLDSSKGYISNIAYDNSFTPSQDGFVNVTFSNSYWNNGDPNIKIYDSQYEASEVESYGVYTWNLGSELTDAIKKIVQIGYSDYLYGKKWYACGDSFTEGAFEGSTEEYTFSDAPYQGENKVYPFFIGRRTGMDIHNIAVGGMAICPTNRPNNYFSPAIYESIPADADYITLAFGINDGHVSNPIGSIDDATNATFYGAWNVVMDYLITNHPYAKIGIIVMNGLDSDDYAQAMYAIAHKWGVPYLNMWSGEQVPVMNRSGRTDVKASVKALRSYYFRVSESNLHPNVKAHEYESTFIEAWLRTL